MGFHFPSIRMPQVKLPPIRLPPPIKFTPLPPIRLPPPKKIPPPAKINLPPPAKINLPSPVKLHLPPLKLPFNLPPIKLPPPIHIPPPKVDMGALRTATSIIAGIVSITPIGRALVNVAVGIADATTHGKASDYLDNGHKSNGTLSLLPGGRLLQSVANEASHGKSGDTLNRYVPDPKKSIIHDVGVVGKTVITNPNNTGNALKSITQTHIDNAKPTLHSIIATKTTVVNTLVKPIEKTIMKPSLTQISKLKEDIKREIPIKNTLLPVSVIAIVPFVSTLGHDPLKIIPPDSFISKNNLRPLPVVKNDIPIISTLGIIPSLVPPVIPAPISPPKNIFMFSPKTPILSPNIPDNQINSTLGTTTTPVFSNNTPMNSTLGVVDDSPPVNNDTLNNSLPINPTEIKKADSKSEIPIIPITLVCLGIIILMR